jgi:tRNA pseudouridine38-40 synthase
MARYKLIVAYDGTTLSGSQRQAKGRTVQGELERACRALGWPPRRFVLAGRTDAGVHASGQVAALDLDWRHGPDALRDALNAKLPADLAVQAAELAPEGFHPRFDAVSRHYRYHIRCAAVRDPVHERMAWRVWPPLEEREIVDLAKRFLGTHDFSAFGSATRRGGSTVRTVKISEWSRVGDELCFDIAADGFLYRMVRRLVFVQVAVGHGKCRLETLVHALDNGRTSADLPAGLAPPNGLVLVGVYY